jgi:hypothetical protein
MVCCASGIGITETDLQPLIRLRDLNEAARAADASREANGAVYGERLK